MRIVFIGAGNVATHLATELYKYSFEIIQVYSRTLESAKNLSDLVDAKPITDVASIIDDADLYIFSVKDSVLDIIASQLPKNNKLWIHTAGSVSISIFEKYTSHYGVLYPFQTFSKSKKLDWHKIPIFIEASDKSSLNTLENIATQLTEKVFELSSEKRQYLHLTGVFACNFTNHMYTLSEQFLNSINLPFEVALPLIDETANKVHIISPKDAQTGPAIRFDENIINKHIELINDEKTKQIYKIISQNIHETNK